MLYDMHCHLALCAQSVEPGDLSARIRYLDNTVTPREYANAPALDVPQVVRGLGALHWYGGDVDEFRALAADAPFFGEIGLDFGSGAILPPDKAVPWFREVASICAQYPGRILSIHAVQSAGEVLDILEETGALGGNRCIFHWFSGTSDDLVRAKDAGCFFSVNMRMAKSKRGRAYITQIPMGQLLLETDLPHDEHTLYDAAAHEHELEETLEAIASIRGMDVAEVSATVEETSQVLWDTIVG